MNLKMSTGIILGLGLITITVCFYVMLNIPYWSLILKKEKSGLGVRKAISSLVYSSDDFLNKLLKLCVFSLYCYGLYIFVSEIWYKFY